MYDRDPVAKCTDTFLKFATTTRWMPEHGTVTHGSWSSKRPSKNVDIGTGNAHD